MALVEHSQAKLEGLVEVVASRIESYLYALVVLACIVTVPVIFYQGQGVNFPLLTAVDWTVWAIFVIEYGVLLILAPNRKFYAMRSNWHRHC